MRPKRRLKDPLPVAGRGRGERSILRSRRLALGSILLLSAILLTALAVYRTRGTHAPVPLHPLTASPLQSPEEAPLRAAVARAPNDPAPHQALGAYLVAHGHAAEALWEYAVAGGLGRRDPSLWLQGAEAFRLLGLPEVAAARLRGGKREHPEDVPLTLAFAQSLLSTGRPEEALSALRSTKGSIGTTDGLRLLGRVQFAAGDAAGARQTLLEYREREGCASDADHLLGRMAWAMKQTNEARARLGAAAAAETRDAEAQYDAGMAWSEGPGADEQEALRFLNGALRANPRHARAVYQIGWIAYETRGQWQRAVRAYGEALRRDRKLAEAELGLTRVLAPLGMGAEVAYHQAQYLRLKNRLDEAIPFYRRWGELRPERWESPMRVAECLMEMKRDPEAARVLAKAVERFPGNNNLLLLLGQLLRASAPQEAAHLVDQWARSDPKSGQPEWLRGRLAFDAQQTDEAIRWFEAALGKREGDPIFQLSLAEALAHEPTPERLGRARDLLQSATARDPRTPTYPYQLGVVLQALNESDAARGAFQDALDRGSHRDEIFNGLAQAAGRLNAPGPARDFADLARHLRDSQRTEQAAFRRLWQKPSDPATRLAVARVLLDHGEIAPAADHLEVAASAHLPEAAALLQRVRRLLVVQN